MVPPKSIFLTINIFFFSSIWEARLPPGYKKPDPGSSRDDKERYIKAKYERREFLSPLSRGGPGGPAAALVDAVCRSDVAGVSLALGHATDEEVNSAVSARDARRPLHLAAALGHLGIAQLLIWVRIIYIFIFK